MKKPLIALAAVLLLALGIAPVASAAKPDADQDGPLADHWMVPDNARVAHNGEVVYRCATDERGRKHGAPAMGQIEEWIAENHIAAGAAIPVNFHVIYASQGRSEVGNVPEAWLDAQIEVLNNTFAGRGYDGSPVPGAVNTDYVFFKNSVTRTKSPRWFRMTPGSRREQQAKSALVVDPYRSLNIYTCQPSQNLLGWSTFPWDLTSNPSMDGVVLHWNSLPGGSLSPYNLGGTGSHEVGHWMGLYHTFQGGCDGGDCSGAGDLVCDTPGEATATAGCPSGKDTCPEPGLDPIHNYMDYSYDSCYDNFTPGQNARADYMMVTYRPWFFGRWVQDARRTLGPRDRGDILVSFTADPNPFNPRAKVSFGLAREGRVTLRAYDIHGRLVATLANGRMAAGNHEVVLNGDRLASGVYMLRLQTEDGVEATRRITLMK